MSAVQIHSLNSHLTKSGSPWFYRLAGQTILSDQPLPPLEAFIIPEERSIGFSKSSLTRSPSPKPGDPIYEGTGWIANGWHDIECHYYPFGYNLCLKGIASFEISIDGEHLSVTRVHPGCTDEDVTVALLGPAIILALALHGTWCLHASAVLYEGRIAAFIGESGFGKSTLANFLGQQPESGFPSVVDDILPVTSDGGSIQAYPHFPQLKIPAHQQPARHLSDQYSLAAIYLLQQAKLKPEEIEIAPCQTSESVLGLVRHSVATHLFESNLLARHFNFCVSVAQSVPIHRLEYPHSRESLPIIRDRLIEDLSLLG